MSLAKALLAAMVSMGALTCAAAESPADPPPDPVKPADAPELAAVVVTARKKSEQLQKVPMSVVAMDAKAQRELGIDNLADVGAYVPGLDQHDQAINSRLTLRGVNSGDNNAFEQSVGVYVDGIYRGRMNQQHIGLFDLERIEVLKGPQVTLYGNSSIGGAISAITRKPGFEPGGEVRLGYEFEYDEARVEAGFDVPVSEQLALRIAGKWRDQREGNSYNHYSGDTEPTVGEGAARLSALWQPSDAWTVSLRHEHGRFDRDGHIFDVYKHVDGQGNPWPGSTFTGIDDGELDVGNGPPFKYQSSFLKTDMDETMVQAEYRTDRFTLSSITGHSRYGFQQSLDVDISPYTLVNTYQDEAYRQFSQELRLAGRATDRIDYLAGLYYQDDHFRNDYLADFNLPLLLASAFGVSPDVTAQLIDPFARHILLDQDTRQWAVFGNVDWQFTDRLTGSVGFRWLAIDKDAHQAVRTASIDHVDGAGPLVDTRWLDPALAPLLLGNPDYLADPTHYVLVLGDGTTVAPVLAPGYALGYALVSAGTGITHEFDDLSRSEHHPMFNASLAYQWADDLLLYANWANGAKAGGFDFLYEGGDRDAVEYAPEQADVFEVGFKKDWRNARLNVAAFHGRYSDLQVSVYDGGIGFVVGNAASSISQGVDAEFEWNLGAGWRVQGLVEYLDFRYDDFATANCSTTERLNGSGPICDWSGERTPFVPKVEGNLALEHLWESGGGWTLRQQLRWSYKGEHATASDNEAQTRQDAYHLLDYRAELAPPGRNWGLALVGRNLTGTRYNVFTSVIPLAPGGAFANVRSKGREIGLEWRVRF
jgi:outer membrane receptor protein involved in Fe transport